jgi:hypothetical protein
MRLKLIGIAAFFVLSFVGAVAFGIFRMTGSHQTITCTVTDKDHTIKASSSGSTPVYRVYTNECDVLEVTDDIFLGVFNSASVYGRIQPGHTYKFETVGWRMPIFSTFPDIVSAVEVK